MAENFKVETGGAPDYARLVSANARSPDYARIRGDDTVNSPAHYTQGDIECIDAIDAAVVGKPADEAVCVANVLKYLWRYNLKGGAESVRKAKWYLDRLVRKVESRYMQEAGR